MQQEEKAETAFMLDLDFAILQASKSTLDAAMDWIEQAHDHVERTFEACITDKSRVLFKERKEETHND